MLHVSGLGLYVRKIDTRKYSPQAFAERMVSFGLNWVAIGCVWQEWKDGKLRHGLMNKPDVCRAYSDACARAAVRPFVWGYPWVLGEESFGQDMLEASGDHKLILLDPELGMNPSRGKPGSLAHLDGQRSAREIVNHLASAKVLGLSTYGVVPSWFPLDAFFTGDRAIDFVGGQTYTDDATVDKSISFYQDVIAVRALHQKPQLVPNFGLYSWEKGPDGKRKARSKTPAELRSHLLEFIDEREPVSAMIGWAENFVSKALAPELARFSNLMARGATCLPQH